MSAALTEQLQKLHADIGGAFESFKKDHDQRYDALNRQLTAANNRIEELEARGDRPGRTNPEGLATVGDRGYTVMHTATGPQYIVSGAQRLSNVPGLQKKAPISLDRWAAALVLGNACGDKEALEFLREQHSVATGSTGVLLPAAFAPEWIDMARAQSVLVRLGMRTVTMTEQTLTYSHQTADPTFAFRSSEGASLSATDPTFALRVLTAKTIAVRTQLSLEASQDIPDIGRQLARAYTKAFGAAIDQAGLRGTSPAPTGLQTLSGVTAVASGGSQSDYDKVVDGVIAFLNANNSLEELTGIVSHPNMLGRYNKVKTGLSGDKTVLTKPPLIANVPWLTTTNNDVVPASPQNYMMELGNFGDLVMGVRMDPSIRILDGTASMASNLLVEVVGVARVDICAVRPASFVRITGLTAS